MSTDATKETPDAGARRPRRRVRRSYYLMRRFQHDFLDLLLAQGPSLAVELSDYFDVPTGVSRSFVGRAIRDLAAERLTRKVSVVPEVVRQGGRHAHLHYRWVLNIEGAGVEVWKRANPVPPVPEADDTGLTA
jgi:hypothetical protein